VTVFQHAFYQTQQGEVFEQSQCMQHEHVLANFFSCILHNLGYSAVDPGRRIWTRNTKKVIVCLADDFNICGADLSKSPGNWFDANTVVITDNLITYDTQYTVIRTPASYFGIFGYRPALQNFLPSHRFHLSVNRIDSQRQLILFELLAQSGGLDAVQQQDLVNFNARDAYESNDTVQNLQQNFTKHWQPLAEHYTGVYDQHWDTVLNSLPLLTHSLAIEQAGLAAYLNLVVETYAGNTTITFSEKIFRALVTPAPWTLFAALGAVQHLVDLGFDVMSDIVDHSYDQYVQDDWPGCRKIANYISTGLANYHRIQQIDAVVLAARCAQAAEHNQQRLATMRAQWPGDFAQWLPGVIAQLE
jgi:hypothetical protein